MIRPLFVLLAALALVAAACGGDDDAASPVAATSTPAASEAAFPATIVTDGSEVTLEAPPQRIAALSATHVEMLYAMGAGDRLVAGDLFSNYPAAAQQLEMVDSFNLSVEAVVALDPDLVILTFDPVDAVTALEAVGIPSLLFATATSLEDVYDQIALLGMATGRGDAAAALVTEMQTDIAAIVEEVGDAGSGVSYYHETDPFSFYTPNSDSFIGRLYGLLGMENIADAAPDELGSGFPQLSPEYIIESNPDMIFLAASGESLATVRARDGWDTMTAVAEGAVVNLDPDVASRWGPRVVELLAAIGDAVGSP